MTLIGLEFCWRSGSFRREQRLPPLLGRLSVDADPPSTSMSPPARLHAADMVAASSEAEQLG